MKFVKFTHVDALTGVSVLDAPAAGGPTFPDVPGLEFLWARESAYPTTTPELFGRCPDGSQTDVPGVLSVLTQAEIDAELSSEMAAREAKLIAEVVAATQKRLDDFAQTRGYDGILSAATYAASAVPKFAAEGAAAVQARDATWATLYQILADVKAGHRPRPAGFVAIEGELPALEWPAQGV